MIPDKIKQELLLELQKNKSFRWYQGWERSSGYVKSYLNRGDGYFDVRLYCEWKKKKEPTPTEQDELLAEELNKLCEKKGHPHVQKDFRVHVICRFFRESRKCLDDLRGDISEHTEVIISALEKSPEFDLLPIQNLHNALKNLVACLDTERAIETFSKDDDK